MAFHDWNHDGKKDFTDDFIDKLAKRAYEKKLGARGIKKAFDEMIMCTDLDWIDWELIHEELYQRVEKHDLSKFNKKEFNICRLQA